MLRQLIACTLLITLSGCGTHENPELQAFADSFRRANQAASSEQMLTLYELEGSTEATLSLLKNALHYELGMPILSIEFEPLKGTPEESINYNHQGVDYVATLKPLQRMRVRYDTEDHFESLFTIGQNTANEWRIVSSRPVQTP